MSEHEIRYDLLVQEAMRGIVRKVLVQAATYGLPGDHHFYIVFNTLANGVILSKRLREQYPEEMTIVLQHQFWGLQISDERFEVQLSFNGIPERLVVPFTSIKAFVDPSVPYGFQLGETETSDDETPLGMLLPGLAGEAHSGSEGETGPVPLSDIGEEREDGTVALNERAIEDTGTSDGTAELEPNEDDKQSAKIVELDSFRKK